MKNNGGQYEKYADGNAEMSKISLEKSDLDGDFLCFEN